MHQVPHSRGMVGILQNEQTPSPSSISFPQKRHSWCLRTADISLGWHCAPRLDSARFRFCSGAPQRHWQSATPSVQTQAKQPLQTPEFTLGPFCEIPISYHPIIPHPLAPFCGVRAAPRRLTFRTPRSTCFLGTKPLFGGTNATETYQQGSLSQGTETLETINQGKRWG